MIDLGKISIQDVFLKMQMIFMRSKSGFAFKKELVCYKQNKKCRVHYFLILVLRKLSHWNCVVVYNL